jgi:hypothetical protein
MLRNGALGLTLDLPLVETGTEIGPSKGNRIWMAEGLLAPQGQFHEMGQL